MGQNLGLGNWKGGVSINWDGEDHRWMRFGERSRAAFEMSFRYPSEHANYRLIWGLGRGPDQNYKFGNKWQNAIEYTDIKLTKILL